MEAEKKLEWLHKIAKLGMEHAQEDGMQHFDVGGAVNTNTGGLLGSINGLLGLSNNFQANAASLTPGTNAGQLGSAYNTAQGGINQQQNLAGTLTPGVAEGANTESALTGQLQNQAAGLGPNPAQAALNQNTGQNIAQQAALAASVRGAGSNPGLIAQQAAQQGATTQQQAVGQEATLGAQQQLAAESQLQNLASNQVGQGQTAVSGLNQASQNEQGILQNANTAANNAAVQQQSNLNTVNASVAAGNQAANQTTFGGLLSGASSVGGTLGSVLGGIGSVFAHGGLVRMDKGGNVLDANARKHIAPENFALPGRRYPIHDEAHGRNALARVSQYGTPAEKKKVREAVHKKFPSIGDKKMACGGNVVPMASGGMASVGPQSACGQWLASKGGPVQAGRQSEKPVVKGDSLKNDKVPAMLSAGEIVIPRHITQSPNAPQMAAKFVADTLAKRNKKAS